MLKLFFTGCSAYFCYLQKNPAYSKTNELSFKNVLASFEIYFDILRAKAYIGSLDYITIIILLFILYY